MHVYPSLIYHAAIESLFWPPASACNYSSAAFQRLTYQPADLACMSLKVMWPLPFDMSPFTQWSHTLGYLGFKVYFCSFDTEGPKIPAIHDSNASKNFFHRLELSDRASILPTEEVCSFQKYISISGTLVDM